MDYYVHQMLFGLAVSCNPRARALFERMPALSQDATHALWWDYRDRPFSREVFDRVTSGTFSKRPSTSPGRLRLRSPAVFGCNAENVMGRTPAISVIVPVYRVEQYIRRCVDSLLSQTFRDLRCCW